LNAEARNDKHAAQFMHASYGHAQPSTRLRVKLKQNSARYVVTIFRDVLQMSSMVHCWCAIGPAIRGSEGELRYCRAHLRFRAAEPSNANGIFGDDGGTACPCTFSRRFNALFTVPSRC
jgi:hypothetical protein